ncbi:NUDIX domain-containing protein [uncultured Brevundimonas sp.]|uniref:NUDIX hydrolase n=1 Tax=uncultured Brevundimonas sp. TaxID=213418 RepID=UPI00261130D1|nr:NUDIX domain-containing protein [uncultured Brevundimonas sp.]
MSEPFDAQMDLRDAANVGSRQRPRDAATLILTRGGRNLEVLMGRRADSHVFMANKWVFPGGRIDPSDFRAGYTGDLNSETARRLEKELPARRARALALTAIRETFEETGLILGRSAPVASVVGPWREYRQAGALPDLSCLTYIARAITPPGRTRRFDARFFTAPVEALRDPDNIVSSGELDEIAWLPIKDAMALELPSITRFVLGEALEQMENPNRPIPFVRMLHGQHRIERRD